MTKTCNKRWRLGTFRCIHVRWKQKGTVISLFSATYNFEWYIDDFGLKNLGEAFNRVEALNRINMVCAHLYSNDIWKSWMTKSTISYVPIPSNFIQCKTLFLALKCKWFISKIMFIVSHPILYKIIIQYSQNTQFWPQSVKSHLTNDSPRSFVLSASPICSSDQLHQFCSIAHHWVRTVQP